MEQRDTAAPRAPNSQDTTLHLDWHSLGKYPWKKGSDRAKAEAQAHNTTLNGYRGVMLIRPYNFVTETSLRNQLTMASGKAHSQAPYFLLGKEEEGKKEGSRHQPPLSAPPTTPTSLPHKHHFSELTRSTTTNHCHLMGQGSA